MRACASVPLQSLSNVWQSLPQSLVRMEATTRWVLWLVLAMCLAMLAVVAWPQIALWLPAKLGY